MSCLRHPAGAYLRLEGIISMTSRVTEHTAGQHVFGGVDSHADTVHVAVISDNGGHLADVEFATTAAGYAAALAFLSAHGHVIAIGVEGTSSYGAGFTRTARSHGHRVIEVNRPDRAERRRTGKSDPIDAYAAARAALGGEDRLLAREPAHTREHGRSFLGQLVADRVRRDHHPGPGRRHPRGMLCHQRVVRTGGVGQAYVNGHTVIGSRA